MTNENVYETPQYVADARPFHIKADGTWWQGADRFTRLDIVRLLSDSLVLHADGSLWVVRDGAQHPVVADSHVFVVVDWTVEDAGTDSQCIFFYSATGQSWVLGADCTLQIPIDADVNSVSGSESLSTPPYIALQSGLTARLGYGVYYGLIAWQLAHMSDNTPQQGRLRVQSHARLHDLGAL